MSRIVSWALAAALLPAAGTGLSWAGDVNAGGTGAALGILYRLAEEFAVASPGDTLKIIPGMGSSGGISAVIGGALHVSFSGRDLKPQEKAKGLAIFPLIETPFVFVTSHPAPPPLIKADVVAIYGGSLMSWPDGKPIRPILRPRSDGVTDFLIVNFAGMQGALETLRGRPDVPVAATDQDSIDAAAQIENSFAGATLSQVITERPPVQRISIDGVHASVAAMENGAYPYKMPISVVTQSAPPPAVQRFVAFLRSAKAEAIFRDSGAARIGQ